MLSRMTLSHRPERVEQLMLSSWVSRCSHRRVSTAKQTDIEMPRKGGIEATRDIKAMEADGTLLHRTPIIAVTANARLGQIQLVSAGVCLVSSFVLIC